MAFATLPVLGATLSPNQYEEVASPGTMDGLVGTPALAPIATAAGGYDIEIPANRLMHLGGMRASTGSTAVTVTADDNDGGGATRLDLLVARLTRATGLVTPALIQGTPGGPLPSPTNSAFGTGTRDLPLAKVSLVNNGTAVVVTPVAWYIGADGATALAANADCYPPHSRGRRVFDWSTGRVVLSTGSTWVADYEDLGEPLLPLAAGWSDDAFSGSYYSRRNGLVTVSLSARRSGTALPLSQSFPFATLPAGFRPRHKLFITGVINDSATTIASGASGAPTIRHPYGNILGSIDVTGQIAFSEYAVPIKVGAYVYAGSHTFPAQ